MKNDWMFHVIVGLLLATAIILLISLPVKAADFQKQEPICEARIIADYKVKITKDEALEMLKTAEDIGQIDVTYANELRELVQKIYSLTGKDLEKYVVAKCKPKS